MIISKLNNIEGVSTNIPEGAFYIIAKLPVKNAEDFCIWLLEEFNYKNETIMLCPAKDFYKDTNLGIDEVRITYVLDEINLIKSMYILDIGLKIYNNYLL